MIANIGTLNKKVDIAAGVTEEHRGFDTVNYKILHKGIWASIEPLHGEEYYEAQRVKNEEIVKITIRYRETVTEGCKVLYRGHVYEIQSIVDPNMSHECMELRCSEKTRGAKKKTSYKGWEP